MNMTQEQLNDKARKDYESAVESLSSVATHRNMEFKFISRDEFDFDFELGGFHFTINWDYSTNRKMLVYNLIVWHTENNWSRVSPPENVDTWVAESTTIVDLLKKSFLVVAEYEIDALFQSNDEYNDTVGEQM